MSERQRLLESIADTISDYRDGEIARPTPEHVDRWVRQFHANAQVPLLREVDHVFERTYFNRKWIAEFLARLVKNEKLAGPNACAFWKGVDFLRIQQNGRSQEEMLLVFGESLEAQCGLRIQDCGSDGGPYLYLDDVLFSGSRVGNDLSGWLVQGPPPKAIVHVLVVATHTLGEWQSLERLKKEAAAAGKAINFHCWRAVSFENRRSYRDASEVLWPAVLPHDADLHAYMAEEERYPFEPRRPGGKLEQNIFSSEEGRQLLEHELLLAGVRIRSVCQNPSRAIRPLGFSAFGLGFGSMIVTFRNCPNNAPLALWWGDPDAPASSPLSRWYPLLPRKTYRQDVDLADFPF